MSGDELKIHENTGNIGYKYSVQGGQIKTPTPRAQLLFVGVGVFILPPCTVAPLRHQTHNSCAKNSSFNNRNLSLTEVETIC